MRKNDMKSALGYAEAGLQERSGHPTLYMVAIFAAFRLQDPRLPLFIHRAKDNMKLDDPFSRRMPWNHFIDGIAAWNEKNTAKRSVSSNNAVRLLKWTRCAAGCWTVSSNLPEKQKIPSSLFIISKKGSICFVSI